MIVRPLTFLTGIMFVFSGAYLFVVKHQSQSLEDQLGQLAQTSRADEQAIRVLKAQWALEADPSRIAMLAVEFTQLKPMRPGQLVTLAALATDLPAPGSAAPYSNPEDLMPALPGESQGAPSPSGPAIQVNSRVASAAQNKPAATEVAVNQSSDDADLPPPPPAAPQMQVARPAVHLAAYEPVVRPEDKVVSRHVQVEHRARHEVVVPPPAMPRGYVIQTRAEAVVQRPAQPLGARVLRVRAEAQPLTHAAPESANAMDGGSLLGMAQAGSQN